jgi:hypothetical protein
LFQIAALDNLSNAAKPEIMMIELKRFQRQLATCQPTFNFERASVALLARHQRRNACAHDLPMISEWRDPPAFRCNFVAQRGVSHHG